MFNRIIEVMLFIAAGLALILVLFMTIMAGRIAFGAEHRKEFNLENWEHRFAIAKMVVERYQIPIKGKLRPIPKESRNVFIMFCLNSGFARGFHAVPAAIDDANEPLCISSYNNLNNWHDNSGWDNLCNLFNMKYVSKPSETSVLCEKELPEQGRGGGGKATFLKKDIV